MNAEAFRTQVRALLAQRVAAPDAPAPAARGVVVPLRLRGPGDLAVLGELLQRVAASPALAEACAAGLLRFDLGIDAGALASGAPAPASAPCCDACARGQACRCGGDVAAPATHVTPLLRGVVTERDVKALPAGCTAVGLAPRAVLTPLARDALRQRGITVRQSKEA